MIKQIIIENATLIESVLNKNYDVLIKKTKDGGIKIMYFEPKNLKNK